MGGFDSGVGVKAGVDFIFDQLELELQLKSIFFTPGYFSRFLPYLS